ncbi:MAG: DSD1 family PLP-dependent enzyme [Pseudomonadales bacterium]|nr:DSD1 family PLP-dependent enzyme [Pseudomonadales bacterium]
MTALALALRELAARPWQAVVLAEPVPLDALPTPALVLDEGAFERNLERMQVFLAAHGKGMRPHAKTHKCPVIAHRQLAAGAVGICVAKVSEAAAMIGAGVDRVLVTSPVVDAARAGLLAELSRRSTALDVVVDSARGLELLAAAVRPDDRLGVLVDVDVAMGRTGAREADTIVGLAAGASAAPGLVYRGIQHYAGQVMHLDGRDVRRERSLALWARVAEIVERLRAQGLEPPVVTGAGTGTYDIDCEVACLTDLQVGSFVFMDQQYRVIGGAAGPEFADFEVALSVLTTAISQPRSGLVTVDGGYKAFAADAGAPVILGAPLGANDRCEYRFAGDEHGVLLPRGDTLPALGERVRFVVPHCDPTVNLYDWYWVCRDGMAREIWPITARGCSW